MVQQGMHEELRVCDIRAQLKEQLTTLDFAQRLWKLFRVLISGAINTFRETLGETTDMIMEAVDDHIEVFFVQALQLDTFTLKMEFDE